MIGPGTGLVAAAGAVVLAASAGSAPVPDGTGAADLGATRTVPVQSPVEQRVPYKKPRAQLPAANPVEQTVQAADDAEPMIPAVFTGDIPATVLDAYRRARDTVNLAQPGCRLPVELLAAIGKVESGHARSGRVDAHGTTLRPILGPALDGIGFASIPDTDGGVFDADTVWDRAVGPMQFIPGTWKRWASDGNRDQRADPHNIYDASLAAARYLCAANRDLGTPKGLDQAILSYNHSTSYRNLVLRWMATYAGSTVVVPDATDPVVVPALAVPPVSPPSTTPPATTPTTPTTPPATPPTTEPSTPPPPSEPAPPTEPSEPTPPTGPSEPSQPPTADPTTPTEPPASTPTDPVTGLVCGVGGLVGGILGIPVCPSN